MLINEKRKVVSLFSGAGCFDVGFEAAGFRPIFGIDIDKDACDTMRINNDCNIIQAPLKEITNTQIKNLCHLKTKELDLLIGGPPCQPYSKSSYGVLGKSKGFEDERSKTVKEYFRVVEGLLPKVFVIENVPQFITGENIKVKNYMDRTVKQINKKNGTSYKLNYCKLNAADYGVPQIRERLFIIASRFGHDFEIPEPRYFANADADLDMPSFTTTWDAIGDVYMTPKERAELEVGGKWGDLLKSVPAGSNYLWHTERGGGKKIFKWRSRYWNFLLKLHPLLPSWTIAASPGQHTGPFHWEGRRLSQLELQILQTIPTDYLISGSMTSIRKQIGNGVPSALGELLGKEIRRQFFGEKVSSERLKLIPKKRPYTNYFMQKFPTVTKSL